MARSDDKKLQRYVQKACFTEALFHSDQKKFNKQGLDAIEPLIL